MNQRELITGLDACRAASNDLDQPELRAVAERVAADPAAAQLHVTLVRFDAATRQAMCDFPLPAGFADRLTARLREANAPNVTAPDPTNEAAKPSTPVSPAARTVSRRKWLAWSGGLAVAAAAAIAAVMFLRPDEPLTPQDLESARTWREALLTSNDWKPLTPALQRQHQLPDELRLPPTRYRDVSDIVGRDAYAYDISIPGGPDATLFVIHQSARAGIPASAPLRPQSVTLGQSVAYWQKGSVIYVVVVNSDRLDEYRQLLRATQPVA
jgi:hypothetical protein